VVVTLIELDASCMPYGQSASLSWPTGSKRKTDHNCPDGQHVYYPSGDLSAVSWEARWENFPPLINCVSDVVFGRIFLGLNRALVRCQKTGPREHPDVPNPGDWARDVALACVSAINTCARRSGCWARCARCCPIARRGGCGRPSFRAVCRGLNRKGGRLRRRQPLSCQRLR
jgi:hypothetical protein